MKTFTSRPSWLRTIVKSNSDNFFFLCALPVSFYKITEPHVVCRRAMQRHHKLHCGPFQNLFLSFLIWSINQRLSASPSVQPRRSWSWWTRRGLWCAGRVSACQTWTVTKSLGGSPAAAWQESWSSPAHRRSERSPHTNRLSRCVESSQKASKERPDERTEEDPRRDSQRHCTLRWRGHKRLDRPSWEERRGEKKKKRATTRDWDESQM